jgi:hypothetical protein
MDMISIKKILHLSSFFEVRQGTPAAAIRGETGGPSPDGPKTAR